VDYDNCRQVPVSLVPRCLAFVCTVFVEKKMAQESQSQGGEEKPQEAVKPFGNVLGDEHSHKMFAFKYLHVYRRR
jgi:hypothetical protein